MIPGDLYFVKADVTEAFDSILHDKLFEIIRENSREKFKERVQLYEITEWKMANNKKLFLRKRYSFDGIPKNNTILINCTDRNENGKLKEFHTGEFENVIRQMVEFQRIYVNGKLYKVTKGLTQGNSGKFSYHLCDLYYSYMDKIKFDKLTKCDDTVLIRYVDDYLFVSPCLKKSIEFYKMVKRGIREYNVKFNFEKLKTNVTNASNVNEINYYGFAFNFSTMTVKPDYGKYKNTDLLSRIKLRDTFNGFIYDKNEFLKRKLAETNVLKLSPGLIGCNDSNAMRIIMRNAFIMQSVKTVLLTDYLYPKNDKNELYVFKMLIKSFNKIKKFFLKFNYISGDDDDESVKIFIFSALQVFKNRSGQFKTVVKLLKYRFKKYKKRKW